MVGVKKVFTDEPVVQKIEKDTTNGLFVTGGWNGTILTSTQVALESIGFPSKQVHCCITIYTNLVIEQYKSSKKNTSFILQTICRKKSMGDTNKARYDNIHEKTLLNFNY